jgi:hypothetical protein
VGHTGPVTGLLLQPPLISKELSKQYVRSYEDSQFFVQMLLVVLGIIMLVFWFFVLYLWSVQSEFISLFHGFKLWSVQAFFLSRLVVVFHFSLAVFLLLLVDYCSQALTLTS